VSGRDDDHEGIPAERGARQDRVLLFGADQADVVREREDALDDALGGVEAQHHVDAGMPPVESRDEVGRVGRAGGPRHHPQAPAHEAPGAVQVAPGLVDQREDAARVVLQDAPGVGEARAAPDPLEELHAALALELPDLEGHRRLRHRQRLRRAAEAGGARHRLEHAELVEVHGSILAPALLMEWTSFISFASCEAGAMLGP
jgi:hypothetical protein